MSSTALFQLATELPAADIARTLGIHITIAVKWQRAAAGDCGAYAAEISHRATSRTGDSTARRHGTLQHAAARPQQPHTTAPSRPPPAVRRPRGFSGSPPRGPARP
ncbi:hypothetical protein [Streptomyces poriticola]|uniref:hypothetical protein n=1 Tax=Streptomyces poriticola TaxID=3120506 RepID=UPI002FCE4CB4